MPKLRRPLLLLVVPVILVALAACSSGGSAGSPGASSTPPSSGPSGSPSSSSVPVGEIDHATGATDVVLRFENGGGFVPPSFLATEAPIFTLYGDGTVVFRNPATEWPPAIGSIFPANPMRTVKLSEDQIQDLLRFALGDSGLGVARPSYENQQISDAPTAVFTVDAGGVKKAVSIYALGLELEGMPDMPARTAFQKLAGRLGNFDNGGAVPTDVYAPERYRAVLMDGSAAPDQKPWPWSDLEPSDFAFPADPNGFQMATHVLTPAQVAELGLDGIEGGFQGMVIQSPDKSKLYSLSLRPLLPEETE